MMFFIQALVILSAGSVFGAVGMSLLTARKITDAEMRAAAIASAKVELDLLRARLRGIQGHGKDAGKGEIMYNVQSANGKFAKVTLPRV